jgi:hypothetical protein
MGGGYRLPPITLVGELNMATLTDAEKALIRRRIAKLARENDVPITWIKAAINDAAQAVEDILDSAAFKSQTSTAMDTATQSYGITFTNTEKKWIGAYVMFTRYDKDKE